MTSHNPLSIGPGPLGFARRFGVRALALACLAATWMVANQAAAFCTLHACNPDGAGGGSCVRDPMTGCAIDGPPLVRADGCLYFGVQQGAAESGLGMSDRELEEAILNAFEAWASVDCGSGSPSIEAQSVGVVSVDEPFSCNAVPELNVDVWLMSDELSGQEAVTPSSGATAGVTRPSFVHETGHIFDADVVLNKLWFLVQNEAVLRAHLHVVAMHEAGHVLGLAHSIDPDALMHRDYRVTADRALTQDDIDGICELFPPRALECASPRAPEAAFSSSACARAAQDADDMMTGAPPLPARREESGCTVGRAGSDGSSGIMSAVLAVAVYWSRRRPGRGRSRRTVVAFIASLVGTCALALPLLSCSAPEGKSEPEQPAPLAPALGTDPDLRARLKILEGACQLTEPNKHLSCQGAADEELAIEFLRGERSRIAALPTFASMLHSGDEKQRAIASRVLSLGFSAGLGDDLAPGAVDARVSESLLKALQSLPLDQARQVAPVTVHATMLSDVHEKLLPIAATRSDAELLHTVYRRLMVHGRMRALTEIKAAASGNDAALAVAAIEGIRNMQDWTPQEQDVLCPFVLELISHGDPGRSARAAQALGNCTGKHVDALLARGQELHRDGKLDRPRLTAFLDVCKHAENQASGKCAENLRFLESVVRDRKGSGMLRSGALTTISHQVESTSVDSPALSVLKRLAQEHTKDSDPLVARQARNVLAHLERDAAKAQASAN